MILLKQWVLKEPKRWFPLFYKEGEVSVAIRFLKFKMQLQRSSGSTPWQRIINIKKENPLLFFHEKEIWLPVVWPKWPTNLEKYFIKMKGGKGEDKQNHILEFFPSWFVLILEKKGGNKERRENK